MDASSSLRAPKAGRSRFSKALPTPPDLSTQSHQAPSRGMPGSLSAPATPKKNSVLIESVSTPNLRAKANAFDSPLPALPIMTGPARLPARAGNISRKPVPQTSAPPSATGDETSASSLLSAYSRSSADSAQRSSRESESTKDSDPSYSPERERMTNRIPPIPSRKSMETANHANGESIHKVTSNTNTIIDAFPSPPPSRNSLRPAETQNHKTGLTSLPTVPGGHGNESPQEIWRRRTSSKTDASLTITELKVSGSNGSTTSTISHTSGNQIVQHSHSHSQSQPLQPLPPLPPLPPAKLTLQTGQPLPPIQVRPTLVNLAAKSASTSNKSKSVRPAKSAPSLDERKEMRKLLKLSKIKDLVHRGGDDDKDEEGSIVKAEATAQAAGPSVQGTASQLQLQPQSQHSSSTTILGNVTLSPQEIGEATSTVEASARPSPGELPAHDLGRPKLELRTGLEKIDEVSPPGSHQKTTTSFQSEGARVPNNLGGSYPHPHHRPPRISSHSYYAQNGPASAAGESYGRPVHPSIREIQSAAPVMIPFSATANASHINHRPSTSKSTSPDINENLCKASTPISRTPSTATTFLSQRDGSINPRDGAESFREEPPPMSAEAAAAVALFPRTQVWKGKCTEDGVWTPGPLAERHHACYAKHYKLTRSHNSVYPLACQTCGVADNGRRLMCSHCHLRICAPCADLLLANGRDLRTMMAVLTEQGKILKWDASPKRGTFQDV
ncbi:hypothetical protein GGR50DRAFT_694037 [Xylaria sp. CBS 124048]|nr:hypothetical protein GGR50DRAFT_694037 [Xylaria sp. CBS 124048]